MSDVLKRLGLEADDDEHPADATVLGQLGLTPEPDEHPSYTDPYNLGSPEARAAAPSPPQKGLLRRIEEAIDPSTVIPAVARDVGANIASDAGAAARLAGQGAGDVLSNQSATGAGRMALGALGVPMSLVTGPVRSAQNLLTRMTGNPEFADRAAMVFPLNVGTPAIRTVIHETSPMTRAGDVVARAVGDEMPAVLDRLRSNPRLRPIDTNDQLRMAGQGLIASPSSPDASRVLTTSMRNSAAGARDAVKGTYDSTMGAPPDAWEELTRLQNKAQSIGRAKIAPTLIAAKPVDTSDTIAAIDKVLNPTPVKMSPGTTITPTPLQQRLAQVRRDLASGDQEVLTDAGRLHGIQSELRREAADLQASSTGSDRALGRQLMDYRNKLVDDIDAAAPGYKDGLSAYRDQKDIERAFQLGQNLLVNSKDPKTAPGFLRDWMASKDRTPEELAAARTGARQAVEQKMGSIKQSALDPARSGTDVPQIEFNRQKLEILFGKGNTDQMFRHLQDERDIALTNNRGLGNSKTAETQSWQQQLEPRAVSTAPPALPGWATALGLGGTALTSSPTVGAALGGGLVAAGKARSMYDWLARRNEIARNRSIADLITRNDPETIATLSAAAQRVRQRNKLNNLLAPP